MNIKEILQLTSEYLQSRREAEEVISTSLGIKRLQLYLDFEKPLTHTEIAHCRETLKRYASHEPIAYIQGLVDFFGCTIQVNRDVLIPRPETEILASMIAKEPLENKMLLDLCTGSGCIAISLKKRFPSLQVTATDLSAKALDMAKRNALNNQVEIDFVLGDFLSCVNKKYDYVVCNPPYISDEEFQDLDKSVTAFEPKMALVAPDDGLYFYKELAKKAPLLPGGKLFLEIGYNQGPAVYSLFKHFSSCTLEKDWSGHDRFLICKIV